MSKFSVIIVIGYHTVNEILSRKRVIVRKESTAMRLGSKIMTGGFDWWEKTMEHMVLVANDSRESVSSACLQSSDSGGVEGDRNPSLCALVKTAWRRCLSDASMKPHETSCESQP